MASVNIKIELKISFAPYTCYSLKEIFWQLFLLTPDYGAADTSWSFDHLTKSVN